MLSSAAAVGHAFSPATTAEESNVLRGAVNYAEARDPTKQPGRPLFADGGYGTRSQFETEARIKAENPNDLSSWTFSPLATQQGVITPSGLHFERHHGGIPTIDPEKHSLIVHGLVAKPMRFSMADIKQMPSVVRRCFIECSGNSMSEWRQQSARNVQLSHGLISTSEWTGVLFSTLVREVGIQNGAAWVLGEGADAAVMTRSIPIDKIMADGIIAYGQNGEAIRPEQGYPLRLILPGLEGNTHIKWLRRLKVSDGPFMTREETSRYTDLMPDGRAKMFSLVMHPKSVITFPSGEMRLSRPGDYQVKGLAWSGKGRITLVEVSFDGGRTWAAAKIDTPADTMCPVRFSIMWRWDGNGAILQSRCLDDTGEVQPTREALTETVGFNSVYHNNAIHQWFVSKTGAVTHVAA